MSLNQAIPVDPTSSVPNDDRIEALKSLIPEAFSEGRIDFQRLREALGDLVDDQPERYSFTWAGRRDAMRLLQTPSRATLRPVPAESVNWDATKNIFVEGDNLEVLKLLYKSYAGRVRAVIIDPPYNTGKDFIYPDDYSDPLYSYLRMSQQIDDEGNSLVSKREVAGRFHSQWLSMMYPRLFLARQLIAEDGFLFVTIDDSEVKNLRMVLDEIFGEENFISTIIWQKKYTRSNDAAFFSDNHDFVLCYARDRQRAELNLLARTEKMLQAYQNPDNHPKGPWKSTPLHAKSGSGSGFEYTFKSGITWAPPPGTYPRFSPSRLREFEENDEIWFGGDGQATPSRKSFLSEVKDGVTPVTLWLHGEVGHTHEANNELKSLGMAGAFENPKPTRLIRHILELVTAPAEEHIVMDFFAGTGTTGEAVMQQNAADGGNRRFVCVQLPEPCDPTLRGYSTIADITRARLTAAASAIGTGSNVNQPSLLSSSQTDLGFRTFKLGESNFRGWSGVAARNADSYADELKLFADGLHESATINDAIVEVAIKEGYGLDLSIQQVFVDKPNTVSRVTDSYTNQSFLICLDSHVDPALPDILNLKPHDLLICRDSGLTDELAANLALQCRLKTV